VQSPAPGLTLVPAQASLPTLAVPASTPVSVDTILPSEFLTQTSGSADSAKIKL